MTRTTLGCTLLQISNSVVPQTWVIRLSSGSGANSSLTKQHSRSNRQLFSFCSAAYRGIEQADRINYDFSRPFTPIFRTELTQEIEKTGHYYRIKGEGERVWGFWLYQSVAHNFHFLLEPLSWRKTEQLYF